MNGTEERRTERLLDELSGRYQLETRFLEKLRPMTHSILHEEFSDERRLQLMEVLAETCERDLRIRKESARAQEAAQAFLARVRSVLAEMERRRDRLDADRPRDPDTE